MAVAPQDAIYAEFGRRGLTIPLALFRERVGGAKALGKILGALSVTEKVHAGRPRGMARTIRKAFKIERIGGVETLIIPRIKAAPFLRARNRARLPLLDGVRAGADALPAPRKLEAERCDAPDEPLYEYQEAAVNYLCGPQGPFSEERIAGGEGVAYLQMDTGLGKSRVGAGVVARRGHPALIVVPTDAIADQWVDEFSESYPGLKTEVYHNVPKGSRKVPPGPRTHDVVIIIINTFRDKDSSFMEGYGTVVLDEAHEYHSPCNSKALWLAQTQVVLGMSATPEEKPDGLDRYVHLHLGAVIAPKTIPGCNVGIVNWKGEVHVCEYAGHPDHCETATTPSGTMSAIMTIGNLIKDEARLRLIAAKVEWLYRLHETATPEELVRLGLGPRPESAATPARPAGEIRRHGVFVFAEHREYLPAIRSALLERLREDELLVPELEGAAGKAPRKAAGPQVSILRGGVKKAGVTRARRAGSHVVLTTFGFSRRGISLPDMTALVLATPRRNGMRQILGRVLRRGSDESIVRQHVDIVDTRTGLKSQVTDRKKVYMEKKYSVAKESVTWEDFPKLDRPAPARAPQQQLAAGLDEDLAGLSTDDLLAMALGEEPAVAVVAPAAKAAPGPLCLAPVADIDIDELLGAPAGQ